MKTKEEVLKHHVSEYWQQQIDKNHPLMIQVLIAMDEYAQHKQSKNKNIPAVIKSTCDCLFPDFIKVEYKMVCGNCRLPKKQQTVL